MVVGRVGKDEIHCRRGVFDKAERIAFDNTMSFAAKDARHFSDKCQLCLRHFHRCHRSAASRKKFERHRPRACEEVNGGHAFEIYKVSQHVEKVFACEIGCGAGGYVSWNVETTSAVFA